jgi:hypothetical protein
MKSLALAIAVVAVASATSANVQLAEKRICRYVYLRWYWGQP